MLILLVPNYQLVVTNERVLLITRSKLTGTPKALEGEYPRNSVKVLEYRRGNLWSVLRLGRANDPELKLNVRRAARSGADDVVRALDPAKLS